jgi:uncharacterized protein YndB with AHSA1/START domain
VRTATETAATTQEYRVSIEASPEVIWDAITKSEWTERYGYRGRVDYELRPGGAYRAYATEDMLACGAPEVVVEGEVVEAEAPRRLVQTWRALFVPEIAAEPAGRVCFELEPGGNGVTRLSLTHKLEGAPATAAIVSGSIPEMGGGWSFVLGDLKALLEAGDVAAAA